MFIWQVVVDAYNSIFYTRQLYNFFQEQELKKSEVKSLKIDVLNSKSYSELTKTNDKVYFDEETEFLLEEYDQSPSVDDFEEKSDVKNQSGVKV